MQTLTVQMTSGNTGTRLDKSLAQHLPDMSRSRLQLLIEKGCVRLGGATITDAGRKVKSGEHYIIEVPEPEESVLKPLDFPLSVVFEDDHLLVIDKPAGLTVHPAPGHSDDTLVNALLSHCGKSLSGIGGVMRPGIVHRIDKDTSGLLVVAKHDAAHRALSAQLAGRTLKREYIAVVKGLPVPVSGTIRASIGRSPSNRKKMAVVKSGGRDAVTHYKVVKPLNNAALVQCRLETGRTHQIRVHLAHIGHPIIGDPVYGRKLKGIDFPRQALHAASLRLNHPATGREMEFSSKLPFDISQLINELHVDK